MSQESFVDYYEDLQVSPNADLETIERVFRLLAKRYHPDNSRTGDADKFNIIFKSYRVLSDPEKRAAYDATYEGERARQWKVFSENSSTDSFENDKCIRYGILSILYIERRKDASNGGVGMWHLEKLLGWPEKQMEFHIWYLKEKGWIQRSETGGYAITADGVDAVEKNNLLLKKDRLLPPGRESEASRSKDLQTGRNSPFGPHF
jgi:curved DNA-binding protein CbpA